MTDDIIERLNAALSGRYRIERPIGVGGMATVYLAEDLKHERQVALKVLKPELAAVVGSERFLSEIKTTANLHHPHILPLFDSGEADGFLFYAMPYGEDETLRDLLDRDKQLPVDQAVRIAVAVANALHHAHERGVVHRDIKPANILMQDGQPVVADFGIALAVGAAGGSRLTETGLSIGTPYYMSPEQATGDQSVGPASDIYALGAVLYESLTGEPPYSGNTAQAVLVKILQGDPVSAIDVRSSVPKNVDACIRKALEKLPADRFGDAQEFAKALQDSSFRHGTEEAAAAASGGGSRVMAAAGWVVALLVAVGAFAFAGGPDPEARVERFASPFWPDEAPELLGARTYTISPDGSTLVYVGPGSAQGSQQIWVRRLDQLNARPVEEARLASDPAISPDREMLAFSTNVELLITSLSTGSPRKIADGAFPHWAEDGYIYFQAANGAAVRIPEAGGPVDTLAVVQEGGDNLFVDYVFDDRDAGLLTVTTITGSNSWVAYADFESDEISTLTEGALGHFVPETGHLLWATREGTIMAASFDPDHPTEMGPPVPLMSGAYSFSMSRNGRLVYSTAGSAFQLELVWLDKNGGVEPIDPGWSFDPGGLGNSGWSLSPDESRIALKEATEVGDEIWIKELPNGPRNRLTVHDATEYMPRWSPDGERVTFISDRLPGESGQTGQILEMQAWSIDAQGSGQEELLHEHDRGLAGGFLSPDGDWLIIRLGGTITGGLGARDILAVPMNGSGDPIEVATSPEFTEQGPALSPDGRWIAYEANETGVAQIFVRPFPNTQSGKVMVSRDGGIRPVWSPSGEELYFVNPNTREIRSARMDPNTGRATGIETVVEIPPGFVMQDNSDFYHVSRDNERFLMARSYQPETDGNPAGLILVTNYFEELRQRTRN